MEAKELAWGIKIPRFRHQNCNTNQTFIFGGPWVCEGERIFHTQVIIWINTIVSHIDNMAILPRYESSCIVYSSKWYWNKKYHQISIPIFGKKHGILIIHTQMVQENKNNTNPTQVWTHFILACWTHAYVPTQIQTVCLTHCACQHTILSSDYLTSTPTHPWCMLYIRYFVYVWQIPRVCVLGGRGEGVP